jgi:hypothetical protein
VIALHAGGGDRSGSGPGDDAVTRSAGPPEVAIVDRPPGFAAEPEVEVELRGELEAEVGTAAASALPLDLIDQIAHAWRAFKRGQDP